MKSNFGFILIFLKKYSNALKSTSLMPIYTLRTLIAFNGGNAYEYVFK